MPLSRWWLLLTVPIAAAAAVLLAVTVRHLIGAVRRSVLATVPLGAPQPIAFDTAGEFALFVEGPQGFRGGSAVSRARRIPLTLTPDRGGAAIPLRSSLGRQTVAGFTRVREETARFTLAAPGTYWLGATGELPEWAGADADLALVVSRPLGCMIVGYVLVLLVLGFACVGALVMSGVLLTGRSSIASGQNRLQYMKSVTTVRPVVRSTRSSHPDIGSTSMTETTLGGRFTFPGTEMTVNRIGYGAMQLAGPGVFGPPKDPDAAVAVLRAAVEAGVNHIDTSDFYGPHVTNQIIRQALHPYPSGLVIVTKVGARRPADKSWQPAQSPAELTAAVHDNLRNLGLDALDVVNVRAMGMGAGHGPGEGSIAEQVTAVADLQRQGLVRHVGLSNVTAAQVTEAQAITDIVCVQNQYNLAHRDDDALVDDLARRGIAYVPFFPLGGFSPLQSSTLSDVAGRLGATPLQVALAWLLHRSPNILLIPGTSSVAHLRENLAAGQLTLSPDVIAELDGIADTAAAAKH